MRIRLRRVELRYRGGKCGSREGKRGKQKGKDMESFEKDGIRENIYHGIGPRSAKLKAGHS